MLSTPTSDQHRCRPVAADRERLQVTELARRKIAELRDSSSEMTFRAIGKLWGISNAHVSNLHNRKSLGTIGPELERKLAELYFDGSVDDLRREARKIEIGADEPAVRELVVEPLARYPNLAAAAQFARRAADASLLPFIEQAISFFSSTALASESDPSPERWLLDIREKANELRADAREPARVQAREERDRARTDEAKKTGRARLGM